MSPDPQVVVRHVIELLGGPKKAWRAIEEDYSRVAARWEQDTSAIGRILRAHLFVEHFLGEYLTAKNPELGSIDDACLSFFQKVALVGEGSGGIAYLLPGVRHLNLIRNRLAHSLKAELSQHDAQLFLAIGLFRAMREAGCAPATPSSEPIVVLEDFAKHAGLALHASSTRNAEIWAEAFRLAQDECTIDHDCDCSGRRQATAAEPEVVGPHIEHGRRTSR